MNKALVGYTGFVGSNIYDLTTFDRVYNSKNIEDAYGTCPDILVYSAVPSAMFIANQNPCEDFDYIKCAIENIKKIQAKRVVLISSIAVYDCTFDVDENYEIKEDKLLPYGKNRLYLEKWVTEKCKDSVIVRLPAIYGNNLKKNFVYDYINIIPTMLNKSKYVQLKKANSLIENYYVLSDDGFYHCLDSKSKELYLFFKNNDFNATLFTDSRSNYQFYNLKNLWKDILIAIQNNICILNITTEPLNVGELYFYLTGEIFVNELGKKPFDYNVRSIYAELFGGNNGYFMNKYGVMKDLKNYIDMEIKKKWD